MFTSCPKINCNPLTSLQSSTSTSKYLFYLVCEIIYQIHSFTWWPGTHWRMRCWITCVCWYHSEERCCTPGVGLSSPSSSSSVWASTVQLRDGGLTTYLPLAWHVHLEEFFGTSSRCTTCDQSHFLSVSLVIPKSLCASFGVGRNSLLWPGRLWHISRRIFPHCHSSPLDLATPWSLRSPYYHCRSWH